MRKRKIPKIKWNVLLIAGSALLIGVGVFFKNTDVQDLSLALALGLAIIFLTIQSDRIDMLEGELKNLKQEVQALRDR